MTLKPSDNFKLKQETLGSIFKGLELIVQNNGPHVIEVEVVDNTIVIKVVKDAHKVFN